MVETRGRLLKASAVLLAVLWCCTLVSIWQKMGLFNWIGVDYALFSAGSQILTSGRIEAVYEPSLETVSHYLTPFQTFYRPGSGVLRVCPIPHLPVTFLLYTPFQGLAPPWGYGFWVVVNLVLAIVVIKGMASRFPKERAGVAFLLALAFLPLTYALFVGQPIILLLFAFDRTYRGWERGRDFEAGLFCGVLFLKVQYLPFLLLVLLFKRRWRCLCGVGLTVALISTVSLAILGRRGFAAYLNTVNAVSAFRAVHPMICPEQMINWRGLLTNILPLGVPDSQGKTLTLVLSAFTACTLVLIWRGPWDPDQERFPVQVLATLLVTMLATYHNHLPGATLLLVPGMVVLSRGVGSPRLFRLLIVAAVVPTLHFTISRRAEASAMLFVGLMAVTLGLIIGSLITSKVVVEDGDINRAPIAV